MLAKKYRSIIVSISNPYKGLYTVEFKSLGGKFKYYPGQFLHLALDQNYDGTDQWPDSRCFSMQSNPSEETIRISYSVKGEFTKQMEDQLAVGTEVWLKLPYGDLFTQPHSKENTVFIAGGTGITPYLSLFTSSFFNEYVNPRIYLGYKSRSYNIYQNEMNSMDNTSMRINIFYQDQDGIIDIDQIRRENRSDSNFFISGPPVMIKTFKQALIDSGVSASNVLTDDWE